MLLRILTDRGTEYCGKAENHAYQLYLGIENIDHTRTKANSPQTNGICERFHRTMKQEFYDIAFRKSCITASKSCKRTSMNGCENIMKRGLIPGNTATANPQCKPSGMPKSLHNRKISITCKNYRTARLKKRWLADNS